MSKAHKPTKSHAVGMVIRNRWDLTRGALDSLTSCQQLNDDYDLFLIDNASDSSTKSNLKKYIKKGKLPVRNLFRLSSEVSISQAYNLFLIMSQDYEYRTKFDNDIILRSTIPVQPPSDKPAHVVVNESSPADFDPLAGAPRSVGIIKGSKMSKFRQTKKPEVVHTRFLDYMSQFAHEYEVGLVSLLPCTPNVPFNAMLQEASQLSIGGRSFLLGSCMMIAKDIFDQLGYFDERILRKVDIEYSQRALKAGINIGYHPGYWAVHVGYNAPTEPKGIIDYKTELTWKVLQEAEPPSLPYTTIWEKAFWKILPATRKGVIVNLLTETVSEKEQEISSPQI